MGDADVSLLVSVTVSSGEGLLTFHAIYCLKFVASAFCFFEYSDACMDIYEIPTSVIQSRKGSSIY